MLIKNDNNRDHKTKPWLANSSLYYSVSSHYASCGSKDLPQYNPEDATTVNLQWYMGDTSSPIPHRRPVWATILNLLLEGNSHCGEQSGSKLLSVWSAFIFMWPDGRLTDFRHGTSQALTAISDVGYWVTRQTNTNWELRAIFLCSYSRAEGPAYLKNGCIC